MSGPEGFNVNTASLSRNEVARGAVARGNDSTSSVPKIEMDEKAGSIRIRDTRLISKGRRAFCRRLVEAVTRRPGVNKVIVDLASASCRVEFAPGATSSHTMAGVFSESVREASTASLEGDGTPWWQPSTNWVALTAYRLAGGVSLWETLEARPGRIRVRHQGLSGDYERLSRVAVAIAHLDRIEACRAVPWSHRLTIDFRPENGVSDWFLDQAERCFEEL